MAVSIQGNVSNTIYGKGDVCLKINPFDNFRLFTLYENWKSNDRTPLDLSNGQKVYLVFKSSKKEIRIPEYSVINADYNVDKVNGQVLFKISKKNAIDILAMDTRVFYITRLYEVTDYSGGKILSSDEEVLYTGRWKDESENTIDNYTSQIKALMDLLDDRNKQIKDLMDTNAKLMAQNAELSEALNAAQDENEKMSNEISELETELAETGSGEEYEGVVVGEGTHYNIIEGKKYTEDQMQEAMKYLEDIYQV